jgi:hypothetical protein
MKAVPFGPVRVTSEADAQKLLGSLKGPRGKAPTHITLTIVPVARKPSKKPKVALYYWWGDWSGFSFYG